MTILAKSPAPAGGRERPRPRAVPTIGDLSLAVSLRPFSADEYEAMIRAGVLRADDRCELLEGEIVEMSPLGSRHIACVNRLVMRLVPAVGSGAIVSAQNSIRLGDYSEPQPDVALLKARPDYYERSLPRAADVLLVIEVSDTTLAYDRGAKIPIYAANAIAEVWLIDLEADAIEVYSDPSAGSYRAVRHARRGDMLSSPAIAGVELHVTDILGTGTEQQ